MSERSSNSARYLPDGKLNIMGRWKSPGIQSFLTILTKRYLTFNINKVLANICHHLQLVI